MLYLEERKSGDAPKTVHISAVEGEQGQEHSRALVPHLFPAPVQRLKMIHGQQEEPSWSLRGADQTLLGDLYIPNSEPLGTWISMSHLPPSPRPDSEPLGEGLSVVQILLHRYAQAHTSLHLRRHNNIHVQSRSTHVGTHTQVHTCSPDTPPTHTHTRAHSCTDAHTCLCPHLTCSRSPPSPSCDPRPPGAAGTGGQLVGGGEAPGAQGPLAHGPPQWKWGLPLASEGCWEPRGH